MSLEKNGSDAYLHDDPPSYDAHDFGSGLLESVGAFNPFVCGDVSLICSSLRWPQITNV